MCCKFSPILLPLALLFVPLLAIAQGPGALDREAAAHTLLEDGVEGLGRTLESLEAPALTFDQEVQVQSVHDDHLRALDNMLAANGNRREGIEADIRALEDQLFLAAIKFLNPAQRAGFTGSMSAAEIAGLNSDLPEDPDELREYLNDLRSPAGGNNNNNLQIDGFGGGRMPDRDEIQEIRINENSFTSEQSNQGRGQTQILTRGGTGRFNGDFTFNFRDESLDARNAFANSRPPYQRRNFNGNISGPVIRDVLTLTFSAQNNTSEDGDNLQAITPNGFINDAIVRPGYSRGYTTRATAQLAENHVLSSSFSTGSQSQENNVGNTRLPSQGNRQERDNLNFQVKETAILSRSWNNEVEFRYQTNDQRRTPNSDGVHINVAGTLRTGGSQQNTRFTNTQYQFGDLLMYTGSRMALRLGFDGTHRRNWSDSRNNYNGTFNFASLYDYCGALDFAGSQCQVELRAKQAERAAFEAGNPGQTLDITPRPAQTFSIRFGESTSEVSQFDGAGFIQTDLRVRNDLTLSFGARYEWQQNLDDYNNLDPRFGFAYSLGPNTVLRGGSGIFHERLQVSQVNNLLRSSGTVQQSIEIINPTYPDPFLGGTVEESDPALSTVLLRAPELAAPYTWHSEVTLETSLSNGLVLTGSYRFIRGLHLYRERNLNAPFPECTALLPENPANEQVAPCRPRPDRGNINQLESTGTSRDQRLRFGFRHRMSFLNVNGSYEFSSNYSDAVDNPADNYDLAAEWGRDGARHRFNASVNLRLPWNVNMDTRTDWQSGEPYTLRTGTDDNRDTNNNDRPAGVPRNSLTGPGFFEMDMQLSKSIQLRSDRVELEGRSGGPVASSGYYGQRTGVRMTLSASVTNLLNKVHFQNINGVQTSSFFGLPTRARDPRRITVQARFNF